MNETSRLLAQNLQRKDVPIKLVLVPSTPTHRARLHGPDAFFSQSRRTPPLNRNVVRAGLIEKRSMHERTLCDGRHGRCMPPRTRSAPRPVPRSRVNHGKNGSMTNCVRSAAPGLQRHQSWGRGRPLLSFPCSSIHLWSLPLLARMHDGNAAASECALAPFYSQLVSFLRAFPFNFPLCLTSDRSSYRLSLPCTHASPFPSSPVLSKGAAFPLADPATTQCSSLPYLNRTPSESDLFPSS